MNPYFTVSLRLCAILIASSVAQAVEPIVWKWAEGDTARYQLTKTMSMSMDAGPAGKLSTSRREDTVLAWSVEAVEKGEAKLTQATERVVLKTDGPMGQSFKYDSNDEEPPAGMAALLAPMFEAMIADPIEMTMAPTGQIGEVTLTENLAESLKRLPGGGVSDENVIQATKQGSLAFPKKPLEKGDTWETKLELDTPQMGRIRVTTTYVYNGPTEVDGLAVESFTPTAKMESLGSPEGTEVEIVNKGGDGTILFDAEAGRLVESRVSMDFEVRVKLQGQEAVQLVEQTTQIKRLGPSEEPTFADAPK